MDTVETLMKIMAVLRDPDKGCPWDLEQDFSSIAPYTIEEAYEVADAIERSDMDSLCSELGDLFFQVIYHAQLAEERGYFRFEDVVRGVNTKLLRRHPHVFGDQQVKDAKTQSRIWEKQKAVERQPEKDGKTGVIDGVSLNMPALRRAQKLQSRAATVGFDWNDPRLVLDKIVEEIAELKNEISGNMDKNSTREELGDLLFACVNLARHMDIDAEAALRSTNHKFETRFRYIETALAAQNRTLGEATLEEMDRLWEAAKVNEGGT
jgi:nucleoside triphosphate diphosphatase